MNGIKCCQVCCKIITRVSFSWNKVKLFKNPSAIILIIHETATYCSKITEKQNKKEEEGRTKGQKKDI